MPNWKKVITSGSDASLNTLVVSNGITGSLLGTASYAAESLLTTNVKGARDRILFNIATNTTSTDANLTWSGSIFNVGGTINATNGITGSLFGTSSWAVSSSYALTASYAFNPTISGSITGVDYIDFNTGSAVPAWKNGRIFWDNTEGCLSVYNAEADITLQVGQENWTRVFNDTGVTIANGAAVRIIGTHGDHPEIVLAQSIQVSGSSNLINQILGIATHAIEDGTFGYVTTQGLVRGLNTNAFIDGDTLYVSSSAGLLTSTPPDAPYEIIPVAQVVKAGPGGSGILYVAVQQPLDFGDLSSVLVTGSYTDGDLWTYNGPTKTWRHTNQLSGSYGVTGSITATSFTGSLQGTASYATQALSASYASNGGVTQIVAGTNVTLTPSTGVGAVTVNASVTYGAGANTTASFSTTSSWVFNHNLNTQYPIIQAYDTSFNQLVPQSIILTNANTATITFPGNESGYAIASVGGVGTTAATASYVNPLNQNVNLTGQLNVFPTASSPAGIVVSGSGTVGGADYVDFIKVTNTAAGATNPNTSFRKNNTGGIEIINSGYTGTLLTLNENGNMTLSGSLTMPSRPAFRVIGTGGTISSTTTISGSAVTVDFNQGSAYNQTTGKFTAPITGLYQVNVVCRTSSNTNPSINQIIVRKQLSGGGATTTQIMVEWGANTSANHVGGSSIVYLAVGDTLWVDVTAGSISFDGNDNFSAAYIG